MASSGRTVFTVQSLMMLSGNFDRGALLRSLYYYRKEGKVVSPRSGIYCLSGVQYNPYELACSVYGQSYVSLQTVLLSAGVMFQYSDRISCVSSLSRSLTIDGRVYEYRRINPFLWSGMKGICQREGYLEAEPERALCDMMYLYPDMVYFDNTDSLDRAKLLEFSLDYNNETLVKKIRRIYG